MKEIKRYYDNGQLFECYTINDNGKRDGLYERWNRNGKLWERANYKDGKRDGLYEKWYNNGQLKVRANYKNGEEDGLYERWNRNGKLMKRGTYKNDELDGVFERWNFKNGKLDEYERITTARFQCKVRI